MQTHRDFYWKISSHFSVTVIVLACLAGAVYSVRLAYAEYLFRSGRPNAAELAARLVSSQAEYQLRLGHLESAVRLNPYLSSAWIELGMRAEAEGELDRAEQSLQKAAQVDRTFEPSWALANFYFRREKWDQFWKWIRVAAEASYGDRTAVFRLCWQASSDSAVILKRAIPANRNVLDDYVFYLAYSRRFGAVPAAVSRLLPLASKADLGRLLKLCDLLIEQQVHDVQGALELWNGLIARGWLPYQQLDPAGGVSLTNGDFRVAPSNHAFDWRLLSVTGVRSGLMESSRGLLVTFDGHEPEQTDILFQELPMCPSCAYELSLQVRQGDIPPGSGLYWKILDGASSAVIAEMPMQAPFGKLRFVTPRNCSLVKLVLSYRRAAGTSRIEGTQVLSSLALRRDVAAKF